MMDAWSSDWVSRVLQRIGAQGHASFPDFLAAFPCEPYSDLAKRLGHSDIAAVQLEHLHAQLARVAHERDAAQRDSLCRYLSEALRKKGWGVGRYWESRVLGALANWIVMWGQEGWLRGVFEHISELAPDAWIPSGADDPVIVEALHRARKSANE